MRCIEEIGNLNIEVIDGDRGKNYPHKNDLRDSGYCLFLSANNVTRYGFCFDSTVFITKEKDEQLRGGKVKRNDIIITTRGTVGNVCFYDDNIPYEHVRINSGMLIVRCSPEINSKFIYYSLKNRSFQEQIKRIQTGSAQPQLPKSYFVKLTVPIPCRNVQDKIADILSCIDSKIALNNKINDNLERQAEALYCSLFVDFDYMGLFQNTKLGSLQDGWQLKSLSEVTSNIRTRVGSNTYKVLSALNTGCLQPSEDYFNKQVFSKNIKNYIVVEENDFAYSPSRINIGSIGMNSLGYVGCVSPVYVVVRPEKGYHYFLDFFIKSKQFTEEVKIRASGSVRQSLSYADFGQIKVWYPPIKIVEYFNARYEKLLRLIQHYKKENVMLAEIRNTLLPKLMNGEIEL